MWNTLLDAISGIVRCAMGRSNTGIIVYHRISPSVFESHVCRLVRLYNVIPFSRLIDAVERQDWTHMPPRSLVIHFDDGDKGFADLEPVIRKYRLPVVQFLVSGGVGTNRHCWNGKVGSKDKRRLKQMRQHDRLAWLRENVEHEPGREYPDRQMLDEREVRQLMCAGVEFGAHTVTHEELPTCSDETAWKEISECKKELERFVGMPIEHFAYPSGSFSEREAQYVRRAGFRSARTMVRGWNNARSDVFKLKDLGPGDDLSVSQIGHLELISLTRRIRKMSNRARRRCIRLLSAFREGAAAVTQGDGR